MDASLSKLPTTVTFSEASIEQLADHDICGLCNGDLTDPPPVPRENFRFQYRGVSVNICNEKHLFHPQCIVENINENSAFSCSKCNVTAIPEASQLQTVRQLAGYQDEKSTLSSLQRRFQDILQCSTDGIVPGEKITELQQLAVLLDKKRQNPTAEFRTLRGEVHCLLGLNLKTHLTGHHDHHFEQTFASLFIACKTGITAAREPFIEMLANKITLAPSSQKTCFSVLDSIPESEWKDEFVKQAQSSLYLALGQGLLNKHKALPPQGSRFTGSIHDALHYLKKATELENQSGQPFLAECHYFLAKKTYKKDTIDPFLLREANKHLNIAEQLGSEDLKQQVVELRSNLGKHFQKKSKAAVERFKADFSEDREYKLSYYTLKDSWERLDYALKHGTEDVKQEAKNLLAKKEELLSFNRKLPERPVTQDTDW
ncbi:hypothetical protein [Endozoicomonas sp. SCSIO W0465]|uniref:hypothetical protein n=1 Tax=Endozoicomonas sp. SCSIO W0465 TaxID=2918516 RepID=UPI0020760D0F|nr:hypothetical protein [Endozoicomonas sp. SCSIO W0465]USE35101.1 hypothetical protein MJO57_23780 [Endozoicomonas sp. SCSIO W0465]